MATSRLRLAFALGLACALAAPQRARADGGELAIEPSYLPTLSVVRAKDTPFAAAHPTVRFDHAVGLDFSYGLSHRTRLHAGFNFSWPQAFAAAHVDFGGQRDVHFNAHRLQLRVPLGLSVSTDRKQVLDATLLVTVGPEWSRYQRISYTVVRGDKAIRFPHPGGAIIKQTLSYSLFPALRWRFANQAQITTGPRVSVTHAGSLSFAYDLRFTVPIGLGPSF